MEDILQIEYIYTADFVHLQQIPKNNGLPQALGAQSRKTKSTTLNPLGNLMLLWLDGGLSTATETHTQQHKGDFRVFVARKDLTIRLCAETMLHLKPQTNPDSPVSLPL